MASPRDADPLVIDALPADTGVTFNPTRLVTQAGGLPTEVEEDLDSAQPTFWKIRKAEELATPHALQTATEEPAPAPVEYILRRILAVGGFGEVWEANQLSLGRPIAVKKLRDDLIEEMEGCQRSIRRLELAFRQEAVTAASLEHPNILPVHDLGIDEKGHLLMAMKLVRGRPWDEILAEDRRTLPASDFLGKHLPVLMDVMNAVAFAHSRGIVHRDLKPSQVMVGEFGEVLLMDWGIAVVCDEERIPFIDDRLTVPVPNRATAANPAGTVAYMAPEQTEETPERIGRWTDVYLLGGILYELLTLRRPHPAQDRKEAFHQARLGEVEPPEVAAPGRDIPAELEKTALRALSPDPADRHSSVEEMLGDIRDYLSGAGRRRDAMQLLQQASAAVQSLREGAADSYREMGDALNALDRALVLWPQYTTAAALRQDVLESYAREALKRRDLHLALVHAERLKPSPVREELLDDIRREMEEQRRADERLRAAYAAARSSRQRAEQLVTFLLEDLHVALKEVNRLELLEKVSRQALDYFEATGEAELTPEARHMRALALRNIGDVLRGRGDLEKAYATYERFLAQAERLSEEDPSCLPWRADVAEACDRLGVVRYFQGALDEAESWQKRGLDILEELHALAPADHATANRLAHAMHQLGTVAWRRRDLGEAERLQTASLALFEKLVEDHPAEHEYRTNLGWNLGTYGNVLRDKGELRDAIAVTERSVDVRRRLREEDPDNFPRLDDLCWSVTNLALLNEYVGEYDRALEIYEQAIELRRRLAEGDPANAQHRNMLTFILSSMGRVTYGLQKHERAAAVLEEAVKISGELAEQDKTNARERGSHALNCGYYGQVLVVLGRTEEARELLRDALPRAREALAVMPTNGVFQNAVCQNLMLKGQLARFDGDEDAARATWEEALELIMPADWRDTTAQGQGILGEIYTLLEEDDKAAEVWDEMRTRGWIMPRFEAMAAR